MGLAEVDMGRANVTSRAFVLVAALSACAGPRAARVPHPDVGDGRARVAALYRTRTAENVHDYCLGPGDVLRLDVYGWPALSNQEIRVSPAGMVNVPVVGDVPAAGRTEAELRVEIERRLRQGYMRDPQVTLFVERFTSRQVSVTGAVMRPGVYALTRDRRTLYDVLSEAGGLSEQAGGRIAFRPANATACGESTPSDDPPAEPIRITLGRELKPGDVDPLSLPMMPGDSVVVTRGRFLVEGWVANPGLYGGRGQMTALGAESVAGGVLFPADLHHVEIVRARDDGTKKIITIDLARVAHGEAKDVALAEGDVVRFRASIVRMVPYSVYWMLKNVFNVGGGVYVPSA
jgi:polysaccharide export outer membrane protein